MSLPIVITGELLAKLTEEEQQSILDLKEYCEFICGTNKRQTEALKQMRSTVIPDLKKQVTDLKSENEELKDELKRYNQQLEASLRPLLTERDCELNELRKQLETLRESQNSDGIRYATMFSDLHQGFIAGESELEEAKKTIEELEKDNADLRKQINQMIEDGDVWIDEKAKALPILKQLYLSMGGKIDSAGGWSCEMCNQHVDSKQAMQNHYYNIHGIKKKVF